MSGPHRKSSSGLGMLQLEGNTLLAGPNARTSWIGSGQRLKKIMNTNARAGVVNVGLRSARHRDLATLSQQDDPEAAIRDFDRRLAEISSMLTKYKDQVAHDTEAQHHHQSQPGVRSHARHARQQKQEQEGDSYAAQVKALRNVECLGSRAVGEKVQQFRNSAAARQELLTRCKEHQQVRAAQEAKQHGGHRGRHDFILANQLSLRSHPDHYLSPSVSLSRSAQTYSSRPASAVPMSRSQASMGSAAQAVVQARPQSTEPCSRSGMQSWSQHTVVMELTQSTGQIAGRQGSAANVSAGLLPAAGPSRPARCLALQPSLSRSQGQMSGMADAPATWPASNTAQPHQYHTGPLCHDPQLQPHQNKTPMQLPIEPHQPHNTSLQSGSGCQHALSLTLSASAQPGCTAVYSTRRQQAVCSTSEGSDNERGPAAGSMRTSHPRPHTASSMGSGEEEALLLTREARLALTARPASGGSPTRRADFLAQRQALAARRAEMAEEARQRHLQVIEWREQRAQQMAERKQQRDKVEAARRAAAEAQQQLQQRHVAWSGIAALSFKLEFLKKEVLTARQLRPLRALRKKAAVKIATWYHQIIQKRRLEALMQLSQRVSALTKHTLPIKREQVRRGCVGRIIQFLRVVQERGSVPIVVAMSEFRARMKRIQQAWRTALLVRRTQRAILMAYFTRFEKAVIRRNVAAAEVRAGTRQSISYTGHLLQRSAQMGSQQDAVPGDSTTAPAPAPAGEGAGHLQSHTSFASHSPGPGGGRSRKAAEVEDPVLEALLATHKTHLPKDVKVQVVEKAIQAVRLKFMRQMSTYQEAMDMYRAQLPMEQLRTQLLRDAGLEATSHLKLPVHPVMLVLLPRPALKRMLQDGLQLLEERKVAQAQERRRQAELVWLEAQASKQKELEALGYIHPNKAARLAEASFAAVAGDAHSLAVAVTRGDDLGLAAAATNTANIAASGIRPVSGALYTSQMLDKARGEPAAALQQPTHAMGMSPAPVPAAAQQLPSSLHLPPALEPCSGGGGITPGSWSLGAQPISPSWAGMLHKHPQTPSHVVQQNIELELGQVFDSNTQCVPGFKGGCKQSVGAHVKRYPGVPYTIDGVIVDDELHDEASVTGEAAPSTTASEASALPPGRFAHAMTLDKRDW